MKTYSKTSSSIKAICSFFVLFLVVGCSGTSTDFQNDADILRLQHLKYYAEILDKYKKVTDKYPFQGRNDIPIYVHIANDEQIEFTKKGPPYPHEVIPFNDFVREVESVLGKEINEYYDPQYRPAYKPNFYIYLINSDTFFLAVHVHQPFPFAKKIAKHYYKIEVSNHPTSQNQAILPMKLLDSPEFNTELSKPVSKPGFFKERENKYLHYSKSTN